LERIVKVSLLQEYNSSYCQWLHRCIINISGPW
jgi:hypothetical protein